ncbi:MAG: PAS domain S-box protein [Chloroflexi bacterium]|nr:PAS domain S-box protein [Chloroflexota bacterium]
MVMVESSSGSDLRYRQMFEEHTAMMLLLDPADGSIVDANPAACSFYGYSREQFRSLKITDLNTLPPEQIRQNMAFAATRNQNYFVFPHRIASGDIRTVEVHSVPIHILGQVLLYSVIHDITERTLAEAALRKRTEELRLLHEAGQQLSQTLDLDAIYDTLYRVIAGVMDCDSLIVSRFTPDDNLIRCVHLRYEGRVQDPDTLPPVPLGPEGRGTQSVAIRTGQSLLLNDFRAHSRTSVNRYRYNHDGVVKLDDLSRQEEENADLPGAAIIVPMKLEAAVVGMIQVFSARKDAYTDSDLWLVESLAAHVAIASKNAALYQQVQAELLERRRAEAAARAEEQKFRAIFSESPDIILIMDEDGMIRNVNYAVSALLGYAETDVIGQPIARLLPGGNDITCQAWLRSVQSVETHLGTLDFLRANGTVCPMDWMATLIPWEQGQAVLVSLRDTTERRLLEEERLKAEMLYLQIQKERELVELREQFINTISHEFRTPLAVIQSSSDLLEHYRERLPIGRQIEHLHEIKKQVRRMADMIEDVLKLSKARAGKVKFRPAPMNVHEFCKTLIGLVRQSARPTHQIVFSSDRDYREVELDERLLTHILMNLLSNAVKYSPDGGEVRLDVFSDGDGIVFQVSDQGIGIPPEDQEHLFEPFQRGSNADAIEGTGLGLAVVRDSVLLHGGSIHYTSQPDVGTIFTVRLPAAAATC